MPATPPTYEDVTSTAYLWMPLTASPSPETILPESPSTTSASPLAPEEDDFLLDFLSRPDQVVDAPWESWYYYSGWGSGWSPFVDLPNNTPRIPGISVGDVMGPGTAPQGSGSVPHLGSGTGPSEPGTALFEPSTLPLEPGNMVTLGPSIVPSSTTTSHPVPVMSITSEASKEEPTTSLKVSLSFSF